MSNLYFTSWDPLTGSRNQTNRFRAADIIKHLGGNRDLDYYLALEGDCETGELHNHLCHRVRALTYAGDSIRPDRWQLSLRAESPGFIRGEYVKEPMRTQIRLEEYLQKSATKPEWIILGAGRHKYLSQIQKSWIEEVIRTCEQYRIPIYIKNSLSRLVGATLIQQKPLQFNI